MGLQNLEMTPTTILLCILYCQVDITLFVVYKWAYKYINKILIN